MGMRLDKYLKVSHLIKRRTMAKDYIDAGYVKVNGKVAKPSTDIKIGDEIEISSTSGEVTVYENDNDGVLICFWIMRGVLSGSVQLMYSSGAEALIYKNETGHKITYVEKLKDNWYWVETDY